MAKASIKLTCAECGREFKREKICYNREDANRYENWALNNITTCPECHAKEVRAAKTKAAEAETERLSLPALTGTEKQVAWAVVLRHELISRYKLDILLSTKGYTVEELKILSDDIVSGKIKSRASDLIVARAIIAVLTETSAKWFIDNRRD